MYAVEQLALLAAHPQRAALFLDIDGTLAPIVERPEDARVPQDTRIELERLVARYALVACISGRAGADAARLVGIEGLVYVGVHGLELAPEAKQWIEPLRRFASTVDWPAENKGVTLSFHYRGTPDEAAARADLEAVATRARAAGLVAHFGRKVLELRPPVSANKGTAVRALLAGRSISRALYAGDDTTDLDAFRGLGDAVLELAIRIAVTSPEGPDELQREADLVVESPAALVEVLRSL